MKKLLLLSQITVKTLHFFRDLFIFFQAALRPEVGLRPSSSRLGKENLFSLLSFRSVGLGRPAGCLRNQKRGILFLKSGFILLICVGAASCVSTRTFNSLRAEMLAAESEIEYSRGRMEALTTRNDKLAQENEKLTAEIASLSDEHTQLKARYARLLADGSSEAARMLRQLEDNQRELNARSARVEELERLLKAREAALVSIRRKVADALLGFEGKGLSITTRNGKVYVSMDDKLLFRSGSFDIEANGAQAVRDLAVVLAANSDINIMVEGHTDDVPYRGSGNLKDNLDLSAKRATTVTRLLLENKGIAPSRITAAGRGEWVPVVAGTNAEARARNRRTEIILTPKLDELLELMDR